MEGKRKGGGEQPSALPINTRRQVVSGSASTEKYQAEPFERRRCCRCCSPLRHPPATMSSAVMCYTTCTGAMAGHGWLLCNAYRPPGESRSSAAAELALGCEIIRGDIMLEAPREHK